VRLEPPFFALDRFFPPRLAFERPRDFDFLLRFAIVVTLVFSPTKPRERFPQRKSGLRAMPAR